MVTQHFVALTPSSRSKYKRNDMHVIINYKYATRAVWRFRFGLRSCESRGAPGRRRRAFKQVILIKLLLLLSLVRNVGIWYIIQVPGTAKTSSRSRVHTRACVLYILKHDV